MKIQPRWHIDGKLFQGQIS